MSSGNPYVGPRSFLPGEKLYGRDAEAATLQDLLIAERIVLLYSPSGAGKTSLLAAKLLPAMAASGFRVRPVLRPGGAPAVRSAEVSRFTESCLETLGAPPGTRRLSECLGKPVDTELVVFDQFEEVLTVEPGDRDAKADFFAEVGECLRHRARWAIFSMREDYIAGLDPYLRLLPTRLATRFRLDLLDRDRAIDCVREPARSAGVEFTEEAAERLVEDLRDGGPYVEPVQLQVVCVRLWQKPRANASQIRVEDLGGVADVNSALADYYANCVRACASPLAPERAIRAWFDRRLITKQGTRGQVLRGAEQELDDAVVRKLIDSHLVRSEQRHKSVWYELAHDRLVAPVVENNRKWREANLSGLEQQAELWDDQKRQEGFLLSGAALEQAEQWAENMKRQGHELPKLEEDFLAACRRERRRRTSERRRTTAASVAAAIALAGLVWASVAQRKADWSAKAAMAGRVAATALLHREGRTDLASLLAIEAYRLDPGFEAKNALLTTLQSNPYLVRYLHHDAPIEGVAFSPDGRILATGGKDSRIRLWDTGAGTEIRAPLDCGSAVGQLAFSNDGKTLASACKNGGVRLWDMATGNFKTTALRSSDKGAGHLTFSPDGTPRYEGDGLGVEPLPIAADRTETRRIVALAHSPDGNVLALADSTGLYVRKGKPFRDGDRLPGQGMVHDAAFSPDGSYLAAAESGEVYIFDWRTSIVRWRLRSGEASVNAIAFEPGNRLFASAGSDGVAVLWNLWQVDPSVEERETPQWIGNGAFHPNGTMLALATATGFELWDPKSRTKKEDLGKPSAALHRFLAMDVKGQTIAGIGAEGLWLWDASQGRQLGEPLSARRWDDDASGYRVAVSPGGAIAAVSYNGTQPGSFAIRLWDVRKRSVIEKVEDQCWNDLVFSADGTLLAVGCESHILLWHVAANRKLKIPTPRAQPVRFSPDSKLLTAVDKDGGVAAWKVATAEIESVLMDAGQGVTPPAAITRDGQLLALVQRENGILKLREVSSGRAFGLPFHLWRGDDWNPSLAFSADGRMLAVGSDNRKIHFIDLDPDRWAKLACTRANRNLSMQEWRTYVSDTEPYHLTCPNLPPGKGAPGFK